MHAFLDQLVLLHPLQLECLQQQQLVYWPVVQAAVETLLQEAVDSTTITTTAVLQQLS